MKKAISNFMKNCELCAKNNHQRTNIELMEITTAPTQAFDIVSIDTVGPFTKTINGNRYPVTTKWDLTKYVIAAPINDKEANTVARALGDQFILIYGPMKKIKTDLTTEYRKKEIANA